LLSMSDARSMTCSWNGVELALKKRGYPTIAEMKAKGKGR
jgi:hypothetical protein